MNFTNAEYFQYRGRRSKELNMVIRDEMEFIIPEASLDFIPADGRSSDVIFDRGKYKDIEKTFPVRIIREKNKTIATQLRDIAGWLYLSHEYTPLLFSGYPEYFYKALGYSGTSGRDVTRKWLDIDLVFKCQPFVFRLDGEDFREIQPGQTITNPEPFSSLPFVTFTKTNASLDSNIYINGRPFRIAKEAGTGVITIDSENGIAYKEGGVNVSKHCLLSTEGYHPITLEPGRNKISYNNISDLKIRPRWRTLAV